METTPSLSFLSLYPVHFRLSSMFLFLFLGLLPLTEYSERKMFGYIVEFFVLLFCIAVGRGLMRIDSVSSPPPTLCRVSPSRRILPVTAAFSKGHSMLFFWIRYTRDIRTPKKAFSLSRLFLKVVSTIFYIDMSSFRLCGADVQRYQSPQRRQFPTGGFVRSRVFTPNYIQYDDLVANPVSGHWLTTVDAQTFAAKALLTELNSSIHAWINTAQHSQQLSSSMSITRLHTTPSSNTPSTSQPNGL